MELIGAGLPRTATLTQKIALEMLGFGPCYHKVNILHDLERVPQWLEAFLGRRDWDDTFGGYQATVDWPGAFFYKELTEAYGFPWDAYHVNSIDLQAYRTFLASMRNTWTAYMVDARTGNIKWQLGGKHSTFKLPPAASFQFQHDISLLPGSVVTMFDDDCCQITAAGTYLAPAGPSRGLELRFDLKTHTTALVAEYTHGQNFDAAYMGNVQVFPNGNAFVGWGSEPNFSEYTSSGKLLLDASFPSPDLSYRATVASWAGLPGYPPSDTARPSPRKTVVYATGRATEVTS